MIDPASTFLAKAEESLAGAASELANGRYNNCANRRYYACFQAAIHALIRAGIRPRGVQGQWGHDFVQAEFAGQLVNRRGLYSRDLRDTLMRPYSLRQAADYKTDWLSHTEVERALRRARAFVDAVRRGREER